MKNGSARAHHLTVVLFLCGIKSCFGQFNAFVHFGIQEGLPSLEVYDVYQDRKGFIWMATDNGVVRYDGKNMETIQGLPDPVIFGFYEDPRGKLWFRSYSGQLSWFAGDSLGIYRYNDTLVRKCQHDLLYTIVVDNRDNVTFSTSKFYGMIDENGIMTQKAPRQDQADFWKLGNDYAVTWLGKTIVSYNNIIFEVRGGELHFLYRGPSPIIGLSVDHDQTLWVGYANSDCSLYRDFDFSHAVVPEFLKGRSVTRMIQDDQGGYWVTTLKNGAYHIPHPNYQRHFFPDLSRIKVAVPFGSQILLGDDKGDILTAGTKTMAVSHRAAMGTKTIVSAIADGRSNFWVSSERNISEFDSALSLRKVIHLHARGMYRDTEGMIWAFDNARVMQLDKEGDPLHSYKMNTIHRSLLKSGSDFILAARTGFDVFDSAFRLVKTPAQFRDLKVSGITNLSDSSLIVSTVGNGFFVVRKKDWSSQQYSLPSGFISRNVYAVLRVDTAVWIGTENGVAVSSVRSLENNNPDFRFITRRSGLVDDRVNLLVALPTGVGVLSDNGICIVPNEFSSFSEPNTRFYLKNIIVNDDTISIRKEIELQPGQNNILINFGFIDFENQNIFIRSRLSAGSPWSYSSERYLHFERLAPGHYPLDLQFSLDNRHWNQITSNVAFDLLRPWWQRWYFQVVAMLGMLFIFYLTFRIRISILKERNEKLVLVNLHKQGLLQAEIEITERERSRIAKDLHDGAGMNLTLLKLKLYDLFKKNPQQEVSEVVHTLDSTIQEIRDLIYNLTPSGIYRNGIAEAIENYVQRNLRHLPVKIDVFNSGPKVTDHKISLFVFRILQELITNSLKHSDATAISIHLSSYPTTLNIIYEDNGKGFDPHSAKKGTGLLNIESRLEFIHGTMEFSSGEFGVSYIVNVPLHGPADQNPAR